MSLVSTDDNEGSEGGAYGYSPKLMAGKTSPSPKKKSDASAHVSVLSTARRPKAVVILFGWLGAKSKEMEVYAKLYHERECSTVMATAATMSILLKDDAVLGELAVTACREAARLVRQGDMTDIGVGNYIPVLVHAFSNGGAFLVEALERRINQVVTWVPADSDEPTPPSTPSALRGSRQSRSRTPQPVHSAPSDRRHNSRGSSLPATKHDFSGTRPVFNRALSNTVGSPKFNKRRRQKSPMVQRNDLIRTAFNAPAPMQPRYNPDERAYSRDVFLVATRLRLGYLIFDSGPCKVSLHSGLGAARHALKNPLSRTAAQSAFVASHSYRNLMGALRPKPASSDFKQIEGSKQEANVANKGALFWHNMEELTLCPRIAYVYSTADTVCNYKRVELLIKSQAKRGIKVRKWKFNNTGHLQHMKKRTEEYQDMIENLLDQATPSNDEEGWA
eukprot:scaffold39564_cov50-Attheya_sp.AAC.2